MSGSKFATFKDRIRGTLPIIACLLVTIGATWWGISAREPSKSEQLAARLDKICATNRQITNDAQDVAKMNPSYEEAVLLLRIDRATELCGGPPPAPICVSGPIIVYSDGHP
jgi:hypothetical protein